MTRNRQTRHVDNIRAGAGKLRPAVQIRPATVCRPARGRYRHRRILHMGVPQLMRGWYYQLIPLCQTLEKWNVIEF